jgi:cytochrome c553
MKKIILFSLIVSGLFATNCAMCHNGVYQAKLDNFTPQQIEKKMIEFKNGQKMGRSMPGIAKSMSDEEIKKMAEKFGKNK